MMSNKLIELQRIRHRSLVERTTATIMPLDEIDALMLEVQLLRGMRQDAQRVAGLLHTLSARVTVAEFESFCQRAQVGEWDSREYPQIAGTA